MPLDTWLGTTDTNYTTDTNWASGTAPVANDDIILTGAKQISGSDQSGDELDSIIIRQMSGQVGSEDAYLQLDVANNARVEIEAVGVVYLDLGSAAVDVLITGTAATSYPAMGLYLKGTALKTVTVLGTGRVRLVGTTQTADLVVGPNAIVEDDAACTFVDLDCQGTAYIYGVATDLRANGGTVYRYSDDNLTLLGAYAGGEVFDYGGGTITSVEADGGVVDAALNNAARTYSTVSVSGGGTVRKSSTTTVSAIAGRMTLGAV